MVGVTSPVTFVSGVSARFVFWLFWALSVRLFCLLRGTVCGAKCLGHFPRRLATLSICVLFLWIHLCCIALYLDFTYFLSTLWHQVCPDVRRFGWPIAVICEFLRDELVGGLYEFVCYLSFCATLVRFSRDFCVSLYCRELATLRFHSALVCCVPVLFLSHFHRGSFGLL